MTHRISSDERGFTLIEVLIVSALFVVVLGATLSAFTNFTQTSQRTERQIDQVDAARNGLDLMARQLRNLAKRISEPVIARAAADDFVFQTSDPTRTWMRWCVQPGATAGAPATLWFVDTPNAAAVTAEMLGPCPGTGWNRRTVVTDAVVNQVGSRPVFTYVCPPDKAATCPASAADYPLIKGVTAQLAIDADVATRPTEMLVSSAVFLRNQNEEPVASFSWRPSGEPRRIILSGAGSTDPEGRTLRYYWYKGSTAPAFTCDKPPSRSDGHLEGVAPHYSFPDADGPAGTRMNFTLVVCDPGDLQSKPFTGEVQIPS